MTKGKYRSAALVMYQYYSRLESEGLPATDAVIRKQIETLLCIKNALDMIPREERYLTLYQESAMDESEESEDALLPDVKIITCEQIESSISLMTAWTEIREAKGGNMQAFKASMDDTLAILNDSGLYGSALKLALSQKASRGAHSRGCEVSLAPIITSLATRCAVAEEMERQNRELMAATQAKHKPASLRRPRVRGSGFHQPFSSAIGMQGETTTKELWHLLQTLLVNFESDEEVSESLHNLAVEAILVNQPNAVLPIWLKDCFFVSHRILPKQNNVIDEKESTKQLRPRADASLLIYRFIQYGYLQQACNFLCQLLKQFVEKFHELDSYPERGQIEWLSYSTIDNLMEVCEGSLADSISTDSFEELQWTLRTYFDCILRNEHAIGISCNTGA